MSKIPVLIVGAGPSGLMMACQCARFGLSFRIVDSKAGPTRESRAIVTHCRSVEVYDQLGIAHRAKEDGHLLRGLHLYTQGRHRRTVDLSDMGKGKSPFANLLALEQSKNEELLLSALNEYGVDVEWCTAFESMETLDTHCRVSVTKANSTTEIIEADWVIACDGARSPVRHVLNLPFPGGTYSATFYVSDVDVTQSVLNRDFGSAFLTQEGFLLAFPMEGSDCRFRFVGAVPSEAHEKPGWLDNPDFSVVRDAISRLMRQECKMEDPNWFTTYSVHHRKVDNFRAGRVLLVGDAAHVHSPAGGQGMNTGLLDAHNLAWKLAYHVQGKARESIIDTYDEEREPFARQLLRTTDTAFNFLQGRGGWASFLRMTFMPFILAIVLYFKAGRDFFFKTVSQTNISYSQSRLSSMEQKQSGVKSGDRFPAFPVIANEQFLEWSLDMFKEPGFYALDFSKERGASRKEMMDRISTRINCPVLYYDCSVSKEDGEGSRLGHVLYIVRPDMYVGFISAEPTEKKIVDYFVNSVGMIPVS